MAKEKEDEIPDVKGKMPLPTGRNLAAMGNLLGGIGAGITAGLTAKMSERTLLAAAVLQGIFARDTHAGLNLKATAEVCVAAADAVLKRLAEVPDPRGVQPGVQKEQP